jgi:UDP-N-acetyl-alpha-D-quinovosamine dehydrogenase
MVRRAMRSAARAAPKPPGIEDCAVGEIDESTDWSVALSGITCVVHLAGRTHRVREHAMEALNEYRRINVEGTRRLAEHAAAAGVRRLVFLSSIKVNGESSDRPFTEDDAPRPEDAYGISKWEAEQALARVAGKTRLDVTILRPPLVYGPGVAGNFLRLLDLVAHGVPLPFASIENRRSLLYVGSLVAAILKAITAPQAAGRTYLVSDGEDTSTPDLVRKLARELGVGTRLFSCPPLLLEKVAALVGRHRDLERLTGSLQADVSRICRELAWRPPYTLVQGLAQTARWYHGLSAA